MNDTVILAARRTPIGAFQGVLAAATAPQLGAAAARAALADCRRRRADAIDEVIFGCVLPAGLGQAPARQAAIAAGVAAIGAGHDGQQDVRLRHEGGDARPPTRSRAGDASVVLAGGLESMTNAPYLLLKARAGYRMGHGEILDHMFYDGLQSPWDGQAMGCFADATADKYGFTRAEQDAFAAESVRRAQRAVRDGDFAAEIAPVTLKTRKGEQVVAQDETPFALDIAKIPTLKPAFRKDGTVTAASSSSISDGAAAHRHRRRGGRAGARPEAARAHRLLRQPRAGAGVVHHRAGARDPEGARQGRLEGLRRRPLRDQRGVRRGGHGRRARPRPRPGASVNVNGGACALGHPIGATGARLVTTLVHALRKRGLQRGVATQCIGGGEATAICHRDHR